MQITKEQIQNLIALLKRGTFPINGDEATVLSSLKKELEEALSTLIKNETSEEVNK